MQGDKCFHSSGTRDCRSRLLESTRSRGGKYQEHMDGVARGTTWKTAALSREGNMQKPEGVKGMAL